MDWETVAITANELQEEFGSDDLKLFGVDKTVDITHSILPPAVPNAKESSREVSPAYTKTREPTAPRLKANTIRDSKV
jgi:nucleoid-associated protein YgaU